MCRSETNKLRGLIPPVNYTDRATVACRVLRGQHNGSLRPYSRLSRPEPLLFLPSSSSVVLTRQSLSGVKRQEHETDHSPPSSAEVKKAGATPLVVVRN
jgi:hypothetical protein